MEDDLRICMVRPLMDIERRFCFEVISPTKSHILQADTEELYQVRNVILFLTMGPVMTSYNLNQGPIL